MNIPVQQFREILSRTTRHWMAKGLPSRQVLDSTADDLTRWKKSHGITGLWSNRPLMLTATLDDGIGQGLQIIQCYAEVLGVDVIPMGLLQSPDTIVAACRRYGPDFLGLTVLQLDSDEDLCRVGHSLDAKTCLIAGGPVFQFDPEMAGRCNVGYVARNVADFIDFLSTWSRQS